MQIWSSHYWVCNQIWGLLALRGFSVSRRASQPISQPQRLWSAGRPNYPSSPFSSQADSSSPSCTPKHAYTQTQKQSCRRIKMQTNATQMPHRCLRLSMLMGIDNNMAHAHDTDTEQSVAHKQRLLPHHSVRTSAAAAPDEHAMCALCLCSQHTNIHITDTAQLYHCDTPDRLIGTLPVWQAGEGRVFWLQRCLIAQRF